jgi:hypothetical protein
MSVPGNFEPTQSTMNLILPVKEPIAENAMFLRAVLKHLDPAGLNRVGTLHFARFLFIDNDSRFLTFTTFDGTFANYINEFINEAGDAFNLILQYLYIPPDVLPVQPLAVGYTPLAVYIHTTS